MNYIKNTLNIGTIHLLHSENLKHKISYVFDLRKYEIKEFLELILPYLIHKKYQALIVLEWLELTTNNTSKKGINVHSGEYFVDIEEVVIREILHRAIKLLNKKGPNTKEELEEIRKIKQYYDWYYQENYSHLRNKHA